MSLKLDSLTTAVSNVANLARSTVEAHAKAAASDAARVAAEAARDVAHAARATAEAVVASAQNDIDKLVAELEAAIGVTVSTIVPVAAPEVPVVAVAPAVSPEVAALNAAASVPTVATVASVTPAADPVAPAEVHGLAAVSAALESMFRSAPEPKFPPFDPRSNAMPSIPNAPKA